MRAPVPAKLSTSNTPARMLRGTVTTLGCAFLLVLAAATTVVISIKREANLIEALRQRERIEAALDSQARLRRLRLDSMSGTGELQRAMAEPDPLPALHAAFARLAGRFLEFDGAYIVTSSGLVLTGIENGATAGQAGYNGLKHFSARIPGGSAARSAPLASSWVAPIFIHDGLEAIAMLVADVSTASTPLLSGVIGPLKLVGYKRVTDSTLTEISTRYRVADMRLTRTQPGEPNSRIAIPAPDGSIKAWLTWRPDRPGDAVLHQFMWAIGGVGLLFAGIFGLVVYRLRAAAYEVAVRERQIQRLAGQDELSSLPNRRTFDLRLDQELAQLSRTGSSLAVLMLDLDRFKAVNDTYGHTAGDELIRQVAERLSGMMRQGDTVARLGGDEFGIIQTHIGDPSGCVTLCERILQAMTKPFAIHGVATTIGCSIGIAVAKGKEMDRATILKLADTALYRSKNEGRNRYSFFEPHMNRALQVKRMVEEDLRNAIENDQLQIHYQPQVSIDGRTVTGVEALVRWPHPAHGMVPPSDFIGIAEERGLIVPLSEWVLRRACLEAKRWEGIRLSVNVSPIQFRHADFVGNVLRIIEETGFDPTRLELELTEGVVVEDADAAEAAMMDLRSHGIGLALDDFGTGYSSLIYLRRFAFDKIKIDRSFLEYMETTGESAILVHSIAHLGRALGLRVCAEGVETVEQHRFLQAIGCHEMQGFLFSKAVPAAEVDRLLEQEHPFADVLAAA